MFNKRTKLFMVMILCFGFILTGIIQEIVYGDDCWEYVIELESNWDDISRISQGMATFKKYGKYGYVNMEGEVVIEPQWDRAYEFVEGYAKVRTGKLMGFIDTNGNIISEPQWDDAWNFSWGVAQVKKDEKYGLIDKAGNLVSEPIWDVMWDFSDGLACVKKDGKVGFIDTEGNIVIELQWDEAFPFRDGLARVKLDEKYGYIDIYGNIVVDVRWGRLEFFKDGIAIAADSENVEWGFIDTGGNMVAKVPNYYIDSSGNTVEIITVFLSNMSDGVAAFSVNEIFNSDGSISSKNGYINDKGIVISEPIWDLAYDFSDGQALVVKNSFIGKGGEALGDYTFIDTNGELISDLTWDYAYSFKSGMARVKKDDLYGFINLEGEIVLEPQFISALDFREGLASVEIENNKWGYVDTNGNFISKLQWDIAYDFNDGFAIVVEGEKMGLINTRGNIVTELQWDDIDSEIEDYPSNNLYRQRYVKFVDGLVRVRKDDRYGFIDESGNVVVEPIWDYATQYSDGLISVSKDGKYGIIRYTETNMTLETGNLNGNTNNSSDAVAMAEGANLVFRGEKTNFDMPILNVNGRILYPFRECLELMGANVIWIGDTRTAKGTIGNRCVEFTIDSDEYKANGTTKRMDEGLTAFIYDNRTYIPIRYAAEALGYEVKWAENMVFIY